MESRQVPCIGQVVGVLALIVVCLIVLSGIDVSLMDCEPLESPEEASGCGIVWTSICSCCGIAATYEECCPNYGCLFPGAGVFVGLILAVVGLRRYRKTRAKE